MRGEVFSSLIGFGFTERHGDTDEEEVLAGLAVVD
jgi:hypothetical protein